MKRHPYSNLQFPAVHSYPFVAINMVSSIDGKVTSSGTLKPGSLGSIFDRHTMNVIRSHFDAVICGGNTIRQHPYYLGVPKEYEIEREGKGLPSQPLTVILTNSGHLDFDTPLFHNPPYPPIILTSEKGAAALPKKVEQLSEIEICGSNKVILEKALETLYTKYSIRHLLLEGGPSVNYLFLQKKAVNEIFLTLAPRLVGLKSDLTMVMGNRVLFPEPSISLVSYFEYNNELFLRYRLTYSPEKHYGRN